MLVEYRFRTTEFGQAEPSEWSGWVLLTPDVGLTEELYKALLALVLVVVPGVLPNLSLYCGPSNGTHVYTTDYQVRVAT